MPVRHIAVAFALFLPPLWQDTEIKGARISLERKPSAVLNVTIENRRDSSLVAWQIGLSERGSSAIRGIHGSDFSGRKTEPWQTGGPIGPHERRTIAVDLTNSLEVTSGALQFVAFEDGYVEGLPAAVEPWRKARRERVDDLRYWSGVFEFMPRVSESDLRAYLASRLAERSDRREDPSGVRAELQNVLRRYPSGPDVWLGLDRLRADTRSELARLPAVTSPAAEAVTSAVILTQDRAVSTRFAVAIENLRGAAIEAYGYEVVDAATGRFRSGQRTDF